MIILVLALMQVVKAMLALNTAAHRKFSILILLSDRASSTKTGQFLGSVGSSSLDLVVIAHNAPTRCIAEHRRVLHMHHGKVVSLATFHMRFHFLQGFSIAL